MPKTPNGKGKQKQRTTSNINQGKPREQLFPGRWSPDYPRRSEQNGKTNGKRTNNYDALATGSGRAQGGLISKLHGLKDFGFKTFEKLYYSCVVPVSDYGLSVWGYKSYAQLDYR